MNIRLRFLEFLVTFLETYVIGEIISTSDADAKFNFFGLKAEAVALEPNNRRPDFRAQDAMIFFRPQGRRQVFIGAYNRDVALLLHVLVKV